MDHQLRVLEDASRRFAAALASGALDAQVPGCPGWDLHQLGRHLGWVQRWARLAAEHGAEPDTADIDKARPTDTRDQLVGWFISGAQRLVDTLAARPPDSATWHPFGAPQTVAVWARRQTHEAFMHAWDAESAIGDPPPLAAGAAADGVAEYFEVMVPRRLAREGVAPPAGVLEVVCTDGVFASGSARLVVAVDDAAAVSVDAAGARPEATLTGSAEALLLALWARRPLQPAPTESLALAWLAHGGN